MNSQKRTYKIGGVFDQDDKSEIEYTLNEMKSISNVTVDVNSQQVSFAFEPEKIPEEFIKNTINTLGFSILED